MKLITKLTAFSLIMCAAMMPLTVQARENYQEQQIILNNFNTQEQNLANMVNNYVNNGQLSPQQGQVFSNELNQIANESLAGAANPAVTMQVMNDLSSLEAQITASLGTSGQWYPAPVYGTVTGPNRYNWRPRSGGFVHNSQGQRQLQSNGRAEERQFAGQQERNGAGMARQTQANNAIEHANNEHARAGMEHQAQGGKMIARSTATHTQTHEKSTEQREEHR